MNKILLFLSLVGMLLQVQECDGTAGHSVGEVLPDGSVVGAKVEKYIKAKPLEFGGHKYVAFLYHYNSEENGFSVVHAPDCPCRGCETNEITIEKPTIVNTPNNEDSWYYDMD